MFTELVSLKDNRVVRGKLRCGRLTKDLVSGLRSGEIALIDHNGIDEVAARSLIEKRVRAVLNAGESLSGRYPNPGPRLLLEAGIPVMDRLGSKAFALLGNGDRVELRQGSVYAAGGPELAGRRLTYETVLLGARVSERNLEREMKGFLSNTLEFAQREKDFYLSPLPLPSLRVRCDGRHGLVVVRGKDYKEDLKAISGYVRDRRPLLIGVDGGADALIDQGFIPDMIVGDMDSVSDRALRSGAELVVHAYPDGRCPGMKRLRELGLDGHGLPAPGTSEDLALLIAYELGATLIVAVGTHNSFHDFLEKRRDGMASTFLVRLKIGARLMDARGVSTLYHRPVRAAYLGQLFLAAMVPIGVAVLLSPFARGLLSLWVMHLRVKVGI